jgi:hypothetical protein
VKIWIRLESRGFERFFVTFGKTWIQWFRPSFSN